MKLISVRGARTHNLKNVNVDIPRDRLTVITGLSGSGKSSLAFDTLYAEGQRLYVESISAYARQFLELRPRPDVDSIEGLSPAIAIDQRKSVGSSRSTVGTVTEIADHMRLLFARVGVPYCPKHEKPLTMSSIASIVEHILRLSDQERIMILSPVSRGKTGDFRPFFEKVLADGYMRFRIDGEIQVLEQPLSLDDGQPHDVDIVVDRLRVTSDSRERMAESCQSASELSKGRVFIEEMDGAMHYEFSTRFACPLCEFSVPKLEPAHFSSSNPKGCCTHCNGTGMARDFDVEKIVQNPELSIEAGAIPGWDARNGRKFERIKAVLALFDVSPYASWLTIPDEIRHVILYGNEATRALVPTFAGVVTELEQIWKSEKTTDHMRQGMEVYRSDVVCPVCQGKRLREEMLSVYVGDGEARYTYGNMEALSLKELHEVLQTLTFSDLHRPVAERLLGAISNRLSFLNNVGLGYLSLNRRTDTLSGGEVQRIRLAGQIGSGLTGVMYVLDEPSIGLHQRDNERLLGSLKSLRDLGNTVIVVEHDEDAMRAADFLIDMGPKAGDLGGYVIAAGTPEEVMSCPNSITGQYLKGALSIPVPTRRHRANRGWLTLTGAQGHNLKNVTLKVPLGLLTVVTGVSGSGKSSLVIDTLYVAMARILRRVRNVAPLPYDSLDNIEAFDGVVMVDQTPIGRTPRSNPATYTGIFTHIREVFEQTQMARERGYTASRFSFNVKGGRCEACQGDGIVCMEMQFLPDVYVPCEVCQGKRYNRETLEVRYAGKNIADVLEMTVDEALPFFKSYPKITRVLLALVDVGLGYIRLGQSATTFSGGEAQRIKLATELARPESGRTLYILDEPTTGLHFQDIVQLLDVLRRLIKVGNTVVLIEHNLDVIKSADYVVDLGPDGGDAGGYILAEGTPEKVAKSSKSITAPYLQSLIKSA